MLKRKERPKSQLLYPSFFLVLVLLQPKLVGRRIGGHANFMERLTPT